MKQQINFYCCAAWGMSAVITTSPAAALAADAAPHKKSATLPNIVYILTDDMGYGDVSILNKRDQKIRTPNIDRIGREGMIFTDAHSGSAVCTPTRYGVITGRYAWRSRLKRGVLGGYSDHLIDPERMTVAGLLKKQGYHTAAVGKWHMGMDLPFKADKGPNKKLPAVNWDHKIKNSPVANGFDYFFGISASLDMPPYIFIENDRFLGEATAVSPKISHCRRGPMEPDFKFDQVLPKLTEKTVSLIDEYSKDGPFFIYFAMPAPHTPLVPSKQFQGRNKLGPYADFCEEVDWYVGKVIEALEKNGIAQNTLLIFTSDNGCAPYIGVKDLEEQGHYPSYIYRGYKADIFEGGHRVPFMVRWPEKVPAGSTSAETICLTDLMATCADVTGAVLPDNAGEDSVSILPVLSGKKLAHPLREATVHHSINGSFALRQGTWKLEMCPGSGGWGDPRPPKARELNLPKIQLYDLSQDISERKNVYKEHPETVASMQKLMAKYIKDGRSTPGKPQPYDIPKKWHQIRWVDDI